MNHDWFPLVQCLSMEGLSLLDLNDLASLGRTPGRCSGPCRSTAFFPCPCILVGLHGLGVPAVELFDSFSPKRIFMEPNRFNHAGVQV